MASGAERLSRGQARWRRGIPSLDEQAQARGTRPIGDGSFYVREELFPEPGELNEFLEHVRWSRAMSVPGGAR
jgi:hypothetical protein